MSRQALAVQLVISFSGCVDYAHRLLVNDVVVVVAQLPSAITTMVSPRPPLSDAFASGLPLLLLLLLPRELLTCRRVEEMMVRR